MALSDAKVRNAKARSKAYKIYDGEGMFLLVTPTGSKYWRFKYHFGKEKLLALGVYPDVSLADARDRRAQARKTLAAGSDPAEVKKQGKRATQLSGANTFEAIGREWFEKQKQKWKTGTARTHLNRLEQHLFPKLGNRPISEIDPPELLSVLRAVEGSGALDTARRVSQICGKIFMYAIATGCASRNPVPDLRGALQPPVTTHRSYLKETELPEFLKKLSAYDGILQTQLALRLLLLTFVRTIELRGARWNEIHWENDEWRIPASRMKMKEEHIVPLSQQTKSLLKQLEKLTGGEGYLFPNQMNPNKCMSENTMLYALYRLGYHSRATGHGFRSTASTSLNENGFSPDVIERQLAHGERNKVRAAYNYAQYLPERREMMQWWADRLDCLASGKAVKNRLRSPRVRRPA